MVGDVEQAQRGGTGVVGQRHLRPQLRQHQRGGHAPLRVGGVRERKALHHDSLQRRRTPRDAGFFAAL